jgi:signal transduction histidine kinase
MQQTLVQASPVSPMSSVAQRQIVHDLRNLFGIVCSAKRLLEGQPAKVRRLALLQAIETAAMRGGELTTRLLAPPQQDVKARRLDLNQQIMSLDPMIGAMRSRVQLDLCDDYLSLCADPDAIDAVVFELLANATAAGATSVTVRTRRAGTRVWLMIADNGCGMDPVTLARARRCEDQWGEHGAGLCRIAQFARDAHARLHLRSRAGHGTVVTINLPTVLRIAVGEPGAKPSLKFPSK